jgi:hypothetical protein
VIITSGEFPFLSAYLSLSESGNNDAMSNSTSNVTCPINSIALDLAFQVEAICGHETCSTRLCYQLFSQYFTSVLQVVTQCLAAQTTFRNVLFRPCQLDPQGREAATRPELKITWRRRQAIQGDDVRRQLLTWPVLAVPRTLLYIYPFSVPISPIPRLDSPHGPFQITLGIPRLTNQ